MDFNKCVVCGLYKLDEKLNVHKCKLIGIPVNEVEECDPPHLRKEEKRKLTGG